MEDTNTVTREWVLLICRNQNHCSRVSGTWTELYRQSGMSSRNSRHTCLRPLLLTFLLPGTFLSQLCTPQLCQALPKWCLKIVAFSAFHLLCPSAILIFLYPFFLLQSTFSCVICYLRLLCVAAWGQGFLAVLFTAIESVALTYLMYVEWWVTEGTQKLRRVGKDILDRGNGIRKGTKMGQ